MKHKTAIWIAALCILIHNHALADAFPSSSEALGGPVLSVELLGSYEIGFKSNTGLLAWGGMAAVFAPFGWDLNAGPEFALEFRKYFHEKENKIWAFSVYSGVAYNFLGEPYGAFTPGLKITRKKTVNGFLRLEPYISLSYPFYSDGNHPFLPYLTFGYRFVFEIKK